MASSRYQTLRPFSAWRYLCGIIAEPVGPTSVEEYLAPSAGVKESTAALRTRSGHGVVILVAELRQVPVLAAEAETIEIFRAFRPKYPPEASHVVPCGLVFSSS